MGRASKAARDWALQRDARRNKTQEIIWDEGDLGPAPVALRPAE